MMLYTVLVVILQESGEADGRLRFVKDGDISEVIESSGHLDEVGDSVAGEVVVFGVFHRSLCDC